MGDGTVALIVERHGSARPKPSWRTRPGRARRRSRDDDRRVRDSRSYLLFYNGPDEPCATPLENVVRVEKVTRRQVESIGGKRTMQYRGAFLPLVTLSDAARVNAIGEDQELVVIVARLGEREVGLLAAMPVDVIESKATIDAVTHRQTGIAGSTIIRDTTVLVADIFELARAAFPEWNLQGGCEETGVAGGCQVLLAEDSDFFRAQVRRYLESDGYQIVEAPDGEAAWELLQQNPESIKAIVADLEMPRMNGFELAVRIRRDSRFAQLPMVALSSLASEEDIAKGKTAGFDDYQIKLDREQLLASLRALLLRRGIAAPSAAPTENREGFA